MSRTACRVWRLSLLPPPASRYLASGRPSGGWCSGYWYTRYSTGGGAKRHDRADQFAARRDSLRALRTLSALPARQDVFRPADAAQKMRAMRARLFVRRRRRWPGDLRDSDIGLHRCRRGIDRRGEVPAAVLAARGAVGTVDRDGDAGAAAHDQGADDITAIPS